MRITLMLYGWKHLHLFMCYQVLKKDGLPFRMHQHKVAWPGLRHKTVNTFWICAAPGGKTTHILEVAPEAQVVAVDIDEQRLSRVYDNLKRLGMKATVKQGDGRYPSQWCGEQQFDRILLDAPCSATGVIRRHPDIKWLRRDRDIPELAQLQSEILDAIWPHLKSGGTLIYATCSVLPEENSLQIKAFLQRTADAELCETGTPEQPGKQNLPGAEEGDGFFYAKLIKK